MRLKRPLEGRRRFEGILEIEADGSFGLLLLEAQPVGDRRRVAPARPGAAKRRAPGAAAQAAQAGQAPARKLIFTLDEIDRAHLVPTVEF